ncbi:MAG: hypothetical protein ACMUIS_05340 [bacterium]
MTEKAYLKKGISENSARKIENVYVGCLSIIRRLAGTADNEMVKRSISNLLDFIICRLSDENEPLLIYTSKIFEQDYIFAHSLNVCLIAIRIGIRLEYDASRLKVLGLLALTHARKDVELPEELLTGITYDEEIDQIIRLADVYDALTHPPSYRHAMVATETLLSILHSDKFFPSHLSKILLEELSLYPEGSWVMLSTREIGRVDKVNKGLILRPKVMVFIDGKGKPFKKKKQIDLAVQKFLYILRPMQHDELKGLIEDL